MNVCRYLVRIILLSSTQMGHSYATESQPKPIVEYPSDTVNQVVFKPVLDEVPSGEIKLNNGKKVNRDDWSSILVFTYKQGSFEIVLCTATVVGPSVILTAAHCIDDKQSGVLPITVEIAGGSIRLDCEMHEDWVAAGPGTSLKSESDYALCTKKNKIFNVPFYENIDINTKIKSGDRVVLSGYGPPRNKGGSSKSGGEKNSLFMGSSEIEKINFSPNSSGVGSMLTTISLTDTEPSLTPGDSGGPLFSITLHARSIIAINSAYVPNPDGANGARSIFAAMSSENLKMFVTKWSQKNDVKICGVGLARGTEGCRD